MSIRQELAMIGMERELNRLRAEQVMQKRREAEAEAFLRACREEMLRAQQMAAVLPYGARYNHPAAILAEKEQASYRMAEHIYKVLTGA